MSLNRVGLPTVRRTTANDHCPPPPPPLPPKSLAMSLLAFEKGCYHTMEDENVVFERGIDGEEVSDHERIPVTRHAN